MRFNFIAVIVCAFALSGCSLLGIETCGLGSTRCKSNVVQVCKTGLGWTDAASCDDVAAAEGGQWECAAPKGVCSEYHECMPVPAKSEPKSSQDAGDSSEKTTRKPDKPEKTKKPDKKE